MKQTWKVGDVVVRDRTTGPTIIGVIIKVGPNPHRSSSIANVSVRWENDHVGKVAEHQIRRIR